MNGLLCKTKGKFDDIVMLQLVDAYCKRLLLYDSEVYWGLNLMTLHFGKYLVLVTKLPVSTIVYWYLLIGRYAE